MKCLDNIIGITQSECECILHELTEEQINKLRESESGLYIDNINGSIGFESIRDLSACMDFYDITLQAKENAIKHFEADIITAVNKKNKPRKTYTGSIGEKTFNKKLTGGKEIQVMHLRPFRVSDLYLKLNSVGVILDDSVNTDVEIYKSVNGEDPELIDTIEITSTQNRLKTEKTNIVLPLSEDGFIIEYYFIYNTQGANPMNNKISCGCSGGSKVDETFSITTWSSEDEDKFEHPNQKHTSEAKGLYLGIQLQCNPSNFLCRTYNNDYAFNKVAAWSILYKAAELIVQSVLDSKEINRTTMMSREQLYGKRNNFRKEYNDRIVYLESITEAGESDCYECRNKRINRTAIFS